MAALHLEAAPDLDLWSMFQVGAQTHRLAVQYHHCSDPPFWTPPRGFKRDTPADDADSCKTSLQSCQIVQVVPQIVLCWMDVPCSRKYFGTGQLMLFLMVHDKLIRQAVHAIEVWQQLRRSVGALSL